MTVAKDGMPIVRIFKQICPVITELHWLMHQSIMYTYIMITSWLHVLVEKASLLRCFHVCLVIINSKLGIKYATHVAWVWVLLAQQDEYIFARGSWVHVKTEHMHSMRQFCPFSNVLCITQSEQEYCRINGSVGYISRFVLTVYSIKYAYGFVLFCSASTTV